MAEPESGAGTRHHRRHRRTERKKARTRAVAAIAALAIIAGVLIVATGLVRFGGSDTPSLANTVQDTSTAGVAAEPTTSTPVSGHPCRSLSVDDPLRLWIGGDSLAGSLGPSLGSITGATGVVQPYFDSRVSSGLSDPGFFDWPHHASSEMARLSPEVVVFIIGANDWSTPNAGDWKTEYAQRVDEMLNTLEGSGRTVYWVGAPILRDQNMNKGVAQVDAVAADVVKRHPNAEYVDAYKLFSDSDGTFAANLPDGTGKVVTMRAGDGVHLTPDGADYLAGAVFKLVDAQCRITAQEVEGHANETIETEGSTQVAPGSGSSSNSSGGATVQTTPPATSPPTTTRPVPVTTAPAPDTTVPTLPPTTTPSHGKPLVLFP